MRATRHNGRSGSHGTYNVKHNDRNAKEGIKKKLAHYNEVLKENNTSQRSHHDRGEVR